MSGAGRNRQGKPKQHKGERGGMTPRGAAGGGKPQQGGRGRAGGGDGRQGAGGVSQGRASAAGRGSAQRSGRSEPDRRGATASRDAGGRDGRGSGRSGAGRAETRASSGRTAPVRGGGYGGQGRGDRERAAAGSPGVPLGRSSGGRHGHEASRVPDEPMLKLGRRKGEWLELRLPGELAAAPLAHIMKHTPLAPKLVSKLAQAKGIAQQGASLRLALFPREARDFPSDWMELNVLYEDDFTLVVNKPAGYEVHPSERGQRHTLAHGVAAYYEMTGQDVRIRHIHRIDKDTTGPVLYAKNEFAHYQYDKAMREKAIERVYLALAEGELAQERGTIDLPIGQDRHHSTKRRVSETGDEAITHYEVVERLPGYTLVRLRLETGRTHQIRVHLSAIGHPLAGDGLYGGKRSVISRQALHGDRLIWQHPWTGERLTARAPLPADFEAALAKLRLAAAGEASE